ncbi:E3 ubiquitin-protein ligase listerin isoform X2 [Magnolia sinica]|uniref:E3 ubiquitin-protein ligase listerin isoform X2 n=1 Tax=Magnolia sinica TaxID=86752 RepID=UPI00265AC351|nr:E3 ubiquitin-protein ligase listerin isoform X2 [Magnolia sinica]
MGRQKGEGGRSKSRPSSSSHAASLLPSGTAPVGFGGYIGSSRLDPSISNDESVPFLDVDGEVAQHLKRLGRKDPTTKLKALTSLCTLFKQRSGEEVVQIVPQWAAFPAQEKRLDALILCASEIFLYLDENLKLTPQAMLDKATPMDELEDMHQRVISSSLLALSTLVDILLEMQVRRPDLENVTTESKHAFRAREVAISYAEKMFSSYKYFLEFLKSQSPGVRSAVFSVLGCFIKHIPHAFSEGNMKTLSVAILGAFQENDPSCHSSMWDAILLFSKKFPDSWSLGNIQKIVLSRFWHFLRNGCYGSQQVSYPALILFLDSIPPKAIAGEEFFLNFFHNLWEGRNSFHSSADRLAFFKAFKECFLWGICNASRYSEGRDAIREFQVNLVDHILVMLLWHDYLLLVSPKIQGDNFSGKSGASSDERPTETLCTRYVESYMQDLGKCIIEILSAISMKECNLLSAFCASFQKDCLEIFQQAESPQKSSEHVEQIVNFLSLLEKHAVQKGETWPLIYLVGPMVVNSFPLIKSLDSTDGVRVLSVVVTIFGPRAIVPQFFSSNTDHSSDFGDEGNDESKLKHFLEVFKDDFVSWCLHQNSSSSSSRLDLLLALLDEQLFSEQWCIIITRATNPEECPETGVGYSSIDRISLLAMLMEKVRGRISSKNYKEGCRPEHWHHELLNSAAVSVACCPPPFHTSYSQFLRVVLSASAEDEQTCFLSKETMIHIFKEVLRKLLPVLIHSSFTWAKHASSLIRCTGAEDLMQTCDSSLSNIVEIAQFAIEVLEGCYSSLKQLDGHCNLVPCILAAVFIIDWECRMASQVEGSPKCIGYKTYIGSSVSTSDGDDDPQAEVDAKLTLTKSIHAIRCKITTYFRKSLSLYSRQKLGDILIQAIRSAVFGADPGCADKAPVSCCEWVQDVLELICQDHHEEQSVLDQLLSEDESWPLWVAPFVSDGRRSATLKEKNAFAAVHTARHHYFIAFVDKLISSLGARRVIVGTVVSYSLAEAPGELVPMLTSYSRVWLAAEILCMWKWEGGSALCTFLPFLREYAKTGKSSPDENLIYSLINILLDGALVHGASGQTFFFDAWVATDDEIENIQDPFLRALISLLSTLMIKDNIWGKDEAVSLFERVLNNLFIGTTVNRNCLRILPFILKVLIQPLRSKSTRADEGGNDVPHDSLQEVQIIDTILGWLQMALSSPPLVTWQTGKHVFEEWVQVVISCYPLSTTGLATLKMALSRNISQSEKTLLMDLFRKQRSDVNVSTLAKKIPLAAPSSIDIPLSVSVQMMLSQLIAVSVGYCWQEFGEDDWDFVLSLSRRWMESAVVVMEEIAENVDVIVSTSSSDNLEVVVDKLEKAVQVPEPSLMNISRIAVFIFSIFCGLPELQLAEDSMISHSLKMEKWDHTKDQILEGILRLFFATGITEAIASSYHEEVSSIVASTRLAHSHFWELVAFSVINSPEYVRNTAVRSVELWELSRGPISSLYAILYSSKPIPSLQVAAYTVLSTEPVCHMAVTKDDTAHCSDQNVVSFQEPGTSHQSESSSEEPVHLRDELSCMVEKPQSDLFQMDLLAQHRVNVFISWALLLTHLQSLPSSSPAREKLIQCIQDNASSTILDCVFQHIPLKLGLGHNLKKKEADLPAEVSKAATSAKRAITTGSLLFAVESLWPVGTEQMASLAGSIYGLMLSLLPAYVRNWFTGSRDHSMSSAIESFTKTWCSPPLLADEFSQIKEAVVADENFSIIMNKSAYEVIATYKKEETGMDLVIRLPSCYPLRPVDVDCTRSLGISEVKQRKWLLSMTAFVRNQNGAIAEAIRIWKSNFDKEFQGIEECPICYSIIHTTNGSLPRLACKTCKHKFHSACLYKWFSTSHKSTCPLCQTPF